MNQTNALSLYMSKTILQIVLYRSTTEFWLLINVVLLILDLRRFFECNWVKSLLKEQPCFQEIVCSREISSVAVSMLNEILVKTQVHKTTYL